MSGESPVGESCLLKANEENDSKLSLVPQRGLVIARHQLYKPILSFLVFLCAALPLTHSTYGSSLRVGASGPPGVASSISGTVSVTTGQGQINHLAGITVKLVGPDPQSPGQSALTDENGRFPYFTRMASSLCPFARAGRRFSSHRRLLLCRIQTGTGTRRLPVAGMLRCRFITRGTNYGAASAVISRLAWFDLHPDA
jgi:hypothetical protein